MRSHSLWVNNYSRQWSRDLVNSCWWRFICRCWVSWKAKWETVSIRLPGNLQRPDQDLLSMTQPHSSLKQHLYHTYFINIVVHRTWLCTNIRLCSFLIYIFVPKVQSFLVVLFLFYFIQLKTPPFGLSLVSTLFVFTRWIARSFFFLYPYDRI